jgi:hypothetical protein
MSLYAITFRKRHFTAYDAAKSASDLTKIYRRFVRDHGRPCAVEILRWKTHADFASHPGAILIKRGLIGEIA